MMKIAVIIASVGRPREIGQLLGCLQEQTVRPVTTVVSVSDATDLPEAVDTGVMVEVGTRGLTTQRNRGLIVALPLADLVVFFDDDFLPTTTTLQNIAVLFESEPGIVAATGLVLSDGVTRGGLTFDEAATIVAAYEEKTSVGVVSSVDVDSVYGCNMAFRSSAVGDLRFDEKLPLYGWQEDVDFAGQIMSLGRVVKTNAFAGVHRGVNKGRSSGVALGFSQIVNPAYLVRKGTMRRGKAGRLMIKNLIANHVRSLKPESFVDRRGRTLGNWLGLFHLLRGRMDPTAIPRLRADPAIRRVQD